MRDLMAMFMEDILQVNAVKFDLMFQMLQPIDDR